MFKSVKSVRNYMKTTIMICLIIAFSMSGFAQGKSNVLNKKEKKEEEEKQKEKEPETDKRLNGRDGEKT